MPLHSVGLFPDGAEQVLAGGGELLAWFVVSHCTSGTL
ncbi:hypothetical protein F652_801 [Enterobacteriaceae bacterium bta3-1]|nr:hypothetical protein F652_801 [Enterobacteriaceae bacterium bta3-1]